MTSSRHAAACSHIPSRVLLLHISCDNTACQSRNCHPANHNHHLHACVSVTENRETNAGREFTGQRGKTERWCSTVTIDMRLYESKDA